MIASDSNLKRAFQQLQELAATSIVDESTGFGAAIAFLTTISVLAGERKKNSQPVNDAQVAVVKGSIDAGTLTISLSLDRDAKLSDDSPSNCWRHLRNCFAHGNWCYDEAAITSTQMPIQLKDYTSDGKTCTFDATIEMPDLLNLAEKLLVETFNALPSTGQSQAPATQ